MLKVEGTLITVATVGYLPAPRQIKFYWNTAILTHVSMATFMLQSMRQNLELLFRPLKTNNQTNKIANPRLTLFAASHFVQQGHKQCPGGVWGASLSC